MAKKFGKFVLVTAALSTAAAAAYYYLKKKDAAGSIPEDEDYDDFSEDLDATEDSHYVSLTPEAKPAEDAEKDFTPLAETVAQATDKAEETVEEFFDEEDSSDEEPVIADN